MVTDPRYPIGRFARPGKLTSAQRLAFIERIASLPTRLRAAVAGRTDAQLDTPYRADGWTLRQVVHHVADSHMNAFIRTKLGVTEDHPTIKPYAEAAWAELPDSRRMPIAPSLELLAALHQRWVVLLRGLPEMAFARTVLHPESGEMSIDVLVALYAWHGDHHLAHITSVEVGARG